MGDERYWFPLHGDYRPKLAPVTATFASLLNASMRLSEMRAEALERAIRANIGRADHVVRIDGDHVTDLVRDADGSALASVVQNWDARQTVISVRAYQYAEPSFVMA